MATAKPLDNADQAWLDSMKSSIDALTLEERATIKRRAASFAREIADVEAGRHPVQSERKAS